MNKRKWSIILAIFFLVQAVSSSEALSLESVSLNPPTSVGANYADGCFKKIYDAICLGLSLYEMDVVGINAKEEIEKRYRGMSLNSEARFDIANMDLGKKGWTRYYPFSIGDKDFIMRIFLTTERSYQPSVPVLYEGSIINPAVTFQILPSLNEILINCKIKPRVSYSASEVSRSS